MSQVLCEGWGAMDGLNLVCICNKGGGINSFTFEEAERECECVVKQIAHLHYVQKVKATRCKMTKTKN